MVVSKCDGEYAFLEDAEDRRHIARGGVVAKLSAIIVTPQDQLAGLFELKLKTLELRRGGEGANGADDALSVTLENAAPQ